MAGRIGRGGTGEDDRVQILKFFVDPMKALGFDSKVQKGARKVTWSRSRKM